VEIFQQALVTVVALAAGAVLCRCVFWFVGPGRYETFSAFVVGLILAAAA